MYPPAGSGAGVIFPAPEAGGFQAAKMVLDLFKPVEEEVQEMEPCPCRR